MASMLANATGLRSASAASTSRPRCAAHAASAAPRRSTLKPVLILPGRGSLRVFSSDTGAENDDKLVGEKGEILQGKQDMPTMGGQGGGMGSEEKRAEMPAQGGAPEGDRAAAGEETQLTGEPSGDPDAGDKMPDQAGKDASQVASEEASQQEERAPLQGDRSSANWGEGGTVRSIE